MACYEYKITVSYARPLLWEVSVWQREVLPHDERTPWRCVASHDAPTLEGHLPATDRLRQILRYMGTA